jgi:hypothetical protein
MVLIGPIITALIIIAVVLMALLVLGVSAGIRWKPPVPTASRRAGPGTARVPGR